ncbi:copper-transporting ATPase 1 [Diaporthe helianthi]|uniref:Copper-transporting ATPase 1 n=1 Tax=Diaporthe helianthi TaxID=158607 RepID=A0A2P5IEN2_DIAHE|nr:copper-transporting ATPase 1 [Diaporthe helianthi]
MASLRRPNRPSTDANGHGQNQADAVCTSSFIVSNMHCPTCVSAIKHEIGENFPAGITWVSPNIVTSVVTVEHDPAVVPKRMAEVLEEAGYEVSGMTSTFADSDGAFASPIDTTAQCCTADAAEEARPKPSSALSNWLSGDRSRSEAARIHLLNCEQCRNSQAVSPTRDPAHGQTDGTHSLAASPSDSRRPSPNQRPSSKGKSGPMSFVTVDSDESSSPDAWRATLAVGGMTCASCVNTIKDALEKKDYTTAVVVNLVSNSATVDFSGKENSDDIVESIEDMGYEAALDKVEPIREEKAESRERNVELALQGVYCKHCPARVVNSLAGFRRQLWIVTEPTQARPIMKISYVPDAPTFTIRQILAAVQASDPALRATIHHPPSLEERSKAAQRKHQWQLLYRALGTLIVAIPTFIIGIVYMSLIPGYNPGKHYLMMPWTSGISRAQIALFVLSTPVYFFAADVFHRRAIKEIRTLWRKGSKVPILRRFYRFGSMNTLMSLGTTIAYVSSVAQLIAAGVHKPEKVNDTDFYFDSVVFLTLFLLFGRWIEAYSKSKTGDAVSALGKLRPTEAVLVERDVSGKEIDTVVKADLLDFGDTVRIRNGSSPPADGVVVKGESNFDESSLTGEARLIKKTPGEAVYAGTVNKGQPILIQITGAAGTSMLDQIVNIVREGQTKRAPMEQIADVLTTYFVPVVTLVAVLTWLIWMILGLSGALPDDYLDVTSGGWVAFALQFAISVFVVACPCGLGLAAPTAIFVGGGLAAKYGILAKGGGEAFEKASRIDCVVFDKTGTLTEGGQPRITDFAYYPDSGTELDEKESMLAAVKAVEEGSSHPVAKAIASFCANQEIDSDVRVNDLHEIPGKGMKAKYHSGNQDFDILVGNEALMLEHRVPISNKVVELLHKWKGEAKSVALVATLLSKPSQASETLLGEQTNEAARSTTWWVIAAALSISDPIRPEAPAIVRALKSRGTRVWMLSGDNDVTARAVATRIGIPPDQVISGVLPTQKADKITYLQSTLKADNEKSDKRATVAMVGDGINDSPALTKADVGIAIGSGSDVAISSAEFVLVKSDLWSVVTLLELSQTVFRRVKVNFAWALVYNLIAVPVAAGVLYPVVSGGNHVKLDPVWASLAMALSSISVVMSSLALRSGIPGIGFRERRREITL